MNGNARENPLLPKSSYAPRYRQTRAIALAKLAYRTIGNCDGDGSCGYQVWSDTSGAKGATPPANITSARVARASCSPPQTAPVQSIHGQPSCK